MIQILLNCTKNILPVLKLSHSVYTKVELTRENYVQFDNYKELYVYTFFTLLTLETLWQLLCFSPSLLIKSISAYTKVGSPCDCTMSFTQVLDDLGL